MAVTAAMRTQIAENYVALFGNAPDAEGLNYWADQYDQKGGTSSALNTVTQDMYNTDPARAFYPLSQADDEFVTSVYTNVLGRSPDAEGLAYWSGRLGSITKGALVREIVDAINNYAGTDTDALNSKALFQNRVAVAEYFAVTKLLNDLTRADTVLDSVTADTATVTEAKNNLDAASLTISLTTNVDTAVGGSGNDFFSAAPGTLSPGDTIDGQNGNDTIQLVLGNDTTAQPALNSIEEIQLVAQGTGAVLDLSLASGYSSIEVWGSGAGVTIDFGYSSIKTLRVRSGFGGRLTYTFGSQSLTSIFDLLISAINSLHPGRFVA